MASLGEDKATYVVYSGIGVLFGAIWVLPRLPKGICGEVQLGGYRALWANPGLDHIGIT